MSGLVAVTLVLAGFGEDATGLATDDETVVTDGVGEADGVGLAVGAGLGSVGPAAAVLTVAAGESFGAAAGAEVPTAGVDVGEDTGRSFAAAVLVVTDVSAVATAGAAATALHNTPAVIVGVGADAGTASAAAAEDDAADGAAAAGVAS